MERKVSLSVEGLARYMPLTEVIDFSAAIGLEYVDLSLTGQDVSKAGCVYNTMDADGVGEYYEALRRHADSRGVKFCQTHGRIRGYRLDEAWNENECRNMDLDLLASKALGAPYCVVHGVHLGLDAAPEDQRRLNTQMFRDYLPLAKKHGVRLADETLGDTHAPDGRDGIDFFGDIEEFERAHEALWAIDDYKDWLFVCMDTGHTNKAARFPGKPLPAEFIRRTGSAIKCLHLNDNDMMTDQHKVPMSGCIDWTDVMKALEEIGYSGVYNMELGLTHYGKNIDIVKAYAEFSVKVMKNILNSCYG